QIRLVTRAPLPGHVPVTEPGGTLHSETGTAKRSTPTGRSIYLLICHLILNHLRKHQRPSRPVQRTLREARVHKIVDGVSTPPAERLHLPQPPIFGSGRVVRATDPEP